MSMHGFGYIVETIVAYKNRNWKNLMVGYKSSTKTP